MYVSALSEVWVVAEGALQRASWAEGQHIGHDEFGPEASVHCSIVGFRHGD